MLLLASGLQDWNMQILGTDFSQKVVERARSGAYQQIEVNRGLPASLLVKHFRRNGLEWQISEAAKRLVKFDTIDLRKPMRTLGPFDMVFSTWGTMRLRGTWAIGILNIILIR